MDLSGVCARDRSFARLAARAWAADMPWETIAYEVPWCDQHAPIPAPPDMVPFSRHFRETADFSRRRVADDWILNGSTYDRPTRLEHY